MSRELCVYLDFLTPAQRQSICDTARETGFTPHFFSTDQFDQALAALERCEVLFAHSPALFFAAPDTLRWYCCAFAGVDPYCKGEGLAAHPQCLLTNSNVYGVTVSEHIVMVTLMLLRRMGDYQPIIREHQWKNDLPIRSVYGSDFTILGTGDIGAHVARSLKGMGAGKIIGINRSGHAADKAFDEILPVSRLEEILPKTRQLILILPGTPDTVHILNRQRLSLLPPEAYVVNAGRGSAIDQEALMEALRAGALAGAALDVMDPEPLPPGHPLWDTPNLLLTPHISGNLTLEYTCTAAVDAFCANLRQYAAGKPLKNLVDRKRGY